MKKSKLWCSHAAIDPRGAALGKIGDGKKRWRDLRDFEQTGHDDVAAFLPEGVTYRQALDYGCGPGRHLSALAVVAAEVFAWDTSPTMRLHARRYSDRENHITLLTDTSLDEQSFSFDLIWCRLVLQHQESSMQIENELATISRLLDYGGTAVIQVVHARLARLPRLRSTVGGLIWRARHGSLPRVPMTAISETEFFDCLRRLDLAVARVRSDAAAPGWDSRTYCIVHKPQA